jgi:hypothetical protein
MWKWQLHSCEVSECMELLTSRPHMTVCTYCLVPNQRSYFKYHILIVTVRYTISLCKKIIKVFWHKVISNIREHLSFSTSDKHISYWGKKVDRAYWEKGVSENIRIWERQSKGRTKGLHVKELNNMYTTRKIIRVIKWGKMKMEGFVTHVR